MLDVGGSRIGTKTDAKGLKMTSEQFERLVSEDFQSIAAACKFCTRKYLHWQSHNDWRDLLQDSLVKAWERRESFSGRAKFSSWLNPIIQRTAIDLYRYERCRPVEVPIYGDYGDYEFDDTEAAIIEALAQEATLLTPGIAEVARKRLAGQRLTPGEKSRLHRWRKTLEDRAA
jgi:DNA-directed RNA polymerase specialized sigma24 family protein